MKEYASDGIRNIGLFGHGSVGKTSLSEALLYTMGVTNRLGRVDEGSTLSDYHPDEIGRKISISTALLHGEWREWKINLLDVPGYSDFIGEALGALRVVDLAVILISGVQGIEVGTEVIYEYADRDEVPRLFFVNRLDAEHANFDRVVSTARERYGTRILPLQFPVKEGPGFNQIIDLVRMKMLTFEPGGKGKPTPADIPAHLAEKAAGMRGQLVEAAAESDEALMEAFFEKDTLNEAQLRVGLRKGILNRTIIPVLCGAATLNIGTGALLDVVGELGPAPNDKETVAGTTPGGEPKVRKRDASSSLCAFVFKTISEAHVGELSLVRVFSGVLKSGTEVLNTNQQAIEKIGQIYLLNGRNRSEIGALTTGDIGALVKLKTTATGHTLCDKTDPMLLPPIVFPEPVISVAIRPKSRGDEDKISNGLHILHEEDPSFIVVNDPELHQTIISGQGDLHLAVIIGRLKEKYGVDVIEERPRIPYRETITAKADEKYRHKKQTGGAGQFAEVWMRIEPLPRGQGFEFGNEVKGGAISSVFIPSIEKGIKQVLEEGPLAGYRVVDVKAVVYDGKEHPVDSKDIAFQIAGREVFKQAFLNAKPILLEPIYDVEVKVPEEVMGEVMGDLSGRRGKIMGMESAGHFQIIKAKVPLSELDQYATTLRSITSGRGIYTRRFSHYESAPKDIEARVIEEAKKRKAEGS